MKLEVPKAVKGQSRKTDAIKKYVVEIKLASRFFLMYLKQRH
jgi:hypothetical protein